MYAARNSLNAWPFTGNPEYYGILKYATEETSSKRATINDIKCGTMAISVVPQTGRDDSSCALLQRSNAQGTLLLFTDIATRNHLGRKPRLLYTPFKKGADKGI